MPELVGYTENKLLEALIVIILSTFLFQGGCYLKGLVCGIHLYEKIYVVNLLMKRYSL